MTIPRAGLDEELGRFYDSARFPEVGERYHRLEATAAAVPANQFAAASAAIRIGDLDQGGALAERALVGFQLAGDRVGIMCATNLLGALDFERGRIDRAGHRFAEAREMAIGLGDVAMVARTNNNLANVANLKGQLTRSLHLYRRALTALMAAGDVAGLAETWHNIALRLRQVGAFRDAAHATERALDAALTADRPGLLALCLLGRADLSLEWQNFEGARDDLTEALALARDGSDPLVGLEARRIQALLSLRTGRLAEAIVEATLVVTAAGQLRSALLATEGTAILALALKASGDRSGAERERAKAVAGFVELSAVDLLERFEVEWDDEAGPLPNLEPTPPA